MSGRTLPRSKRSGPTSAALTVVYQRMLRMVTVYIADAAQARPIVLLLWLISRTSR
eukprot:COSAG01_NODE_235_length_20918_cov_41.045086_19_plen_56_part_00